MYTVQQTQYKCIGQPEDNMSRDCGHLKALKRNSENCFTELIKRQPLKKPIKIHIC